jgi:hypothetical protein
MLESLLHLLLTQMEVPSELESLLTLSPMG